MGQRVSSAGLSVAVVIVVAAVIALRLPSCRESFWVDELHTSWVIHDSFSEIAPRARYGHQQPHYFQLLWVWQQAFGESEIALRFTSVLAVALAAASLIVAVARNRSSITAGGAAGLFLAVESNSLFFGTELRPYAWVILASALSCGFAAALWKQEPSGRQSLSWCLLWLSVGFAAVMQLTSLGVLIWLPLAVALRWLRIDWRMTVQPRPVDLVVIATIVFVALAIMPSRVLEIWSDREIWASFATARSPRQIWQLWPWTIALVAPLGLLVGGHLIRRSSVALRTSADALTSRRITPATFVCLLAAILVGTAWLFWVLSFSGVAPVWHRRYLIAGLPLLAWCFGGGIQAGVERAMLPTKRRPLAVSVLAILLLVTLMQSQQVLPKLLSGRWQVVQRGEDWRSAASFLRQAVAPHDRVVIDPGLIEQSQWDEELRVWPQRIPAGAAEYLAYPLQGIYAVELRPVAAVLAPDLSPLSEILASTPGRSRCWVIARRRAPRLESDLIRRLGLTSPPTDWEVRSFGGVSVAGITSAGAR